MKKIIPISFFIFSLLLFGCGGKQTIKIGFVGPLTGDAANYGKLMSQAVRIAIEEKNAAGGIGGYPVQLVAEDDEGKPEKANAAIEKLSGVDKVWGIVGPVFSSCALAIAPKCQADKIVMISPSSTHKALTSVGNFIFRDVLSDELQAIVFANKMIVISAGEAWHSSNGQGRCSDRPDRLLGIAHHRRLALPSVHASQGRLRNPAPSSRRSKDRR